MDYVWLLIIKSRFYEYFISLLSLVLNDDIILCFCIKCMLIYIFLSSLSVMIVDPWRQYIELVKVRLLSLLGGRNDCQGLGNIPTGLSH